MDMRRQPRRDVNGIVADLHGALDPAVQSALKQELKLQPEALEPALLAAMRVNPFLELSRSEIEEMETQRRFREAERDLILLRQFAARIGGRRVAVFAMPKSGSSFVQSAIGHAANIPFLSLTSLPADGGATASRFGINGREQEIDELALILQTIRGGGSWVAQHHTRFNRYLGFQLRFYRIRPIITVRNIFDAIVSMDDMVMETRTNGEWGLDPPYGLPGNYPELGREDRLALLAQDFGVWLITFMVSWKRAIASGLADPLILSYERDILDPALLTGRLGDFLELGDTQREALADYAGRRPGAEARFNKGVTGRGADIPEDARTMLLTHARRFHIDLGNNGMRYLFGEAAEA